MIDELAAVIIYTNVCLSLPRTNQATIDDEVLRMSTDEIISRTRLLDNDIKVGMGALLLIRVHLHHHVPCTEFICMHIFLARS